MRNSIMINTKFQQQIMWMCIALLAVLNFILGSTGDGLLGPLTPFYTTIVLFVFACVHGIHKYGNHNTDNGVFQDSCRLNC